MATDASGGNPAPDRRVVRLVSSGSVRRVAAGCRYVGPMSPTAQLRDLLERAQGPVVRAALALPPRVQRLLAGPPVVVEGQQLDLEQQLVLRLDRLSGMPETAALPIPEGRRKLAAQSAVMGGRLPIGAVREEQVAGRDARRYTPAARVGTPQPGPLLVFFHGGGWVYGDLDSHDATCRFLAERAGVEVLSVDYRLAPEHPFPAAYDDAVAAYRHVVEHASGLGADPDRIGVGGDSAGGALAAATAIAAARAGWPCAFQLLIYPATDLTRSHASHRTYAEGFYLTRRFMDVATMGYLPDVAQRTDPRASVLYADLPAGLAPAYVCTAGFDPLRDEGEAYARRLSEAGVAVELQRFDSLVHGFVNWVGVGRTSPGHVAEVAEGLRRGLGEPG